MTIQIEQRDLLACVSLPSLSALQTHRVCGIRLDECGLNRNYTARVCVCGLSGLTQNRSKPALTYLVYRGLKRILFGMGQKRSVCMSINVCVFVCVSFLSWYGTFLHHLILRSKIHLYKYEASQDMEQTCKSQRHNDTQTLIHWLARNIIHNIYTHTTAALSMTNREITQRDI